MFLPFIKSYAGLIFYVVILGLVDGCFVVLLPTMTIRLLGSEKASIGWSFLTGVAGITFALGPFVAGKNI